MMMILFLAQLVLPLLWIAWFAIAPPRSFLGMAVQALMTAIALVSIARMGLWLFPPWWTPYVYGLLFVLSLSLGLQRYPPQRRMPSSWLGWLAIIGLVAFGVFVGNEAVRSGAGRLPPTISAVDLAFLL
jgi:hypothetical protein